MSADDLEREIRRSPTMNERFLLGLLDEARSAQCCEHSAEHHDADIGLCDSCNCVNQKYARKS
jgi:hypothetical protein